MNFAKWQGTGNDFVVVEAKEERDWTRLARKQRNWFRRDDRRIHWLDASAGEPYEEAARLVESKLK